MCEEFSPKYYGLCFLGGMLSSGPTHLAITPLDVLKVNMQVQGLTVQKSSSTLVSLISHLTFPILFMFALQFAICRWIRINIIIALFLGLPPFGKKKGLVLSGEVGLASYLDTVFKADSNTVSTSTSRTFTPIRSSSTATGITYSFSAVWLLRLWLMSPFLLSKLSKSAFKSSPISQRVWLMAFHSYTKMKVLLGG